MPSLCRCGRADWPPADSTPQEDTAEVTGDAAGVLPSPGPGAFGSVSLMEPRIDDLKLTPVNDERNEERNEERKERRDLSIVESLGREGHAA